MYIVFLEARSNISSAWNICPNEKRNVAAATADDSPLKSRRDDIPITGGPPERSMRKKPLLIQERLKPS